LCKTFFQIIRIYAQSVHNGLDVTPRHQLIKLNSTHSWITCVLSSSVNYFVVCYF